MSVTIREYEPSDLEVGRDLWRDLTQRHRDIYDSPTIGGNDPGSQFDEYLEKTNLAGPWLAVEGSTVVGMAGLLLSGGEAELEPIVVRPSWRSRGIGTLLIEHVKAQARARGVRSLSIRPVARNVEAIACFHRAGFTTLGHLDLFLQLTDDDDSRWKSEIVIHGNEFRY